MQTPMRLVINQVVTAVYSFKLLIHTDDAPKYFCNRLSEVPELSVTHSILPETKKEMTVRQTGRGSEDTVCRSLLSNNKCTTLREEGRQYMGDRPKNDGGTFVVPGSGCAEVLGPGC
jgi:hypothetical protein